LTQTRTDKCDGVDGRFGIRRGIVRPVDEGEGWENDISGEEIVGIGEESRGGNGPYLPVEAVIVNISADLLSFVGVGLDGLLGRGSKVSQSLPSLTHLMMPANVGGVDPDTHVEGG
jgi:hypothetical protein